MKKYGMILALAVAALSAFGETVKTATQSWVRNYVATNTTSLTTATNYTEKALGDFAETGTVWRALSYGTATRWTDATGCVWKSQIIYPQQIFDKWGNVSFEYDDTFADSIFWHDLNGLYDLTYNTNSFQWVYADFGESFSATQQITVGTNEITLYDNGKTSSMVITFTASEDISFIGRVALTNDVTAEIRRQSLGGIWDEQLEVWWTPIMENGALRYCATTNVNLEVNQ